MDNEYKNEDRKESLKSSDEQKAGEETATEERNVDSAMQLLNFFYMRL